MCFVQSLEKRKHCSCLQSFIILESESKDIRVNQHSTKWTEQHREVGTVSGHILWDIREAGIKGGGGHNVGFKERYRESIPIE